MSEELPRPAARDEQGNPVFGRVQGRTGQWFRTPLDEDGLPVAGWAEEGPPEAPPEAFRDEDGRVLTGIVVMRHGLRMSMPLDASLRPVWPIAALTNQGRTTSPNPGCWPLTEEEVERLEPPPEPPGLPDWQRAAVRDVARDDLGQLLTTRIRAADGGWADVLMTTSGEPLVFEIDLGIAAGGEPQGKEERVMLMRALGGLVVVTVDTVGRPRQSPAWLRTNPPDTAPEGDRQVPPSENSKT
jgi:hypothetical protein